LIVVGLKAFHTMFSQMLVAMKREIPEPIPYPFVIISSTRMTITPARKSCWGGGKGLWVYGHPPGTTEKKKKRKREETHLGDQGDADKDSKLIGRTVEAAHHLHRGLTKRHDHGQHWQKSEIQVRAAKRERFNVLRSYALKCPRRSPYPP